jgi:hypothetical protein
MSIETKPARPTAKWAIAVLIVIAAGVLYKFAPEHPSHPQDEAVARGPRPYTNHEVAFPSEDGSIKLAGTLSLPNGKGPFPAVVLVAAAGPEGRDEEAGGHLVFVVLADHLLRKGVAVLRYDKRGVGDSGGDFSKATFADLVSDADAAFRWLIARPEIDRAHVGMIGHSEGGSICPAVAAREPQVAFVVAMAGSGLSGELRITEHEAYVAQQDGATTTQQDKVRALVGEIFSAVAATPDDTAATARISAFIDEAVASRTIEVLPNLNHVMQTARTGSPAESAMLEESISPLALQKIGDFVARQVTRPGANE